MDFLDDHKKRRGEFIDAEAEREAQAIQDLRKYQVQRPRKGTSATTIDQLVYDEGLTINLFTCPGCGTGRPTDTPCGTCLRIAEIMLQFDRVLAETFLTRDTVSPIEP